MNEIIFHPLGVIHSDNRDPALTPFQPVYSAGRIGQVEVYPEYAEGLRDLEGFSHIFLFYQLHRAPEPRLLTRPFLHDLEHGVFATRAPARPNALGMSVVELIKREGNLLTIANVDILDGSPLLDIKPYVPRFDHITTTRNGWQDEVDEVAAQVRGTRRKPEA